MLALSKILELLGYLDSPHFRTKEDQFEPESVHHFRLAKDRKRERFSVEGFYVFETGRAVTLASRPAVCVAEAPGVADAKRLHRRIWNLGNVPFLIVRLPDQFRVYSGFRYEESSDEGLIVTESSENEKKLHLALTDFSSDSIDSARIWKARQEKLDNRVDTRLLASLKDLALALAQHCSPKLDLTTAHALIGKFVYLRYLRDRNILDDDWLANRRISLETVFGPRATAKGLAHLVDALEARFNGDVFHIDFGPNGQLNDSHVQLVSSVFAGDTILANATGFVRQLHLEFQAYDFRHIPVETLSSIYEQFLHAQHKGRSEGAYYTPEVLADYLLSEVNSVRHLQPGMRVLDASAGSGIFLVLAYRRLIELERRRTGSIDPMRLREILLESIYGVERQRDACNVAMFSLILTLLNYVDPPALHANEDFRFPMILNHATNTTPEHRIFCDDFFNPELKLPIPKDGFDLVVGNPPWIELKPSSKDEKWARQWIKTERFKKENSIAGNRVADAFAVKAGRLLSQDGVAGLLLPATSLLTIEGKRFRKSFFTEFAVARVTNLANLRGNLFGGRATLPTTTLVFRRGTEDRYRDPILHVGPFAANEVAGGAKELWVLTIHSSDIQLVSQVAAASGETSVWKLALWGTARDARTIDLIRQLFPFTLEALCVKRGWGKKIRGKEMPRESAQLRGSNSTEAIVYCEELKDKKRFDLKKFNQLVTSGLHFSLPENALAPIPDDSCYVRKRGGMSGLAVNRPPHLMISATWKNLLIYSEEYFAIPPRQMGISVPSEGKEQGKEQLRALAVYLGSSLVDYSLFFHVPEWGIYSTFPHVVLTAVRSIPTPDFTTEQVAALAATHRELLDEETGFRLRGHDGDRRIAKQRLIDDTVFETLNIDDDLRLLIEDFRDTRLPLDQGHSVLERLGKPPSIKRLQSYGRTLRDELERFLLDEARVSVDLLASPDLIRCEVKLQANGGRHSSPVNVANVTSGHQTKQMLRLLRDRMGERFSQWAYVDRSLRAFEDDAVQIFKAPRLMDWTHTQALNDADDIIAEILAGGEPD